MNRLTCLTSTAALLCGAALCSAQTSISGTLNGKPIKNDLLNPSQQQLEHDFIVSHGRNPGPGDQNEIQTKNLTDARCGNLNRAIRQAARESLIQQLGIVVSQSDLEQTKAATGSPNTKGTEDEFNTLLNAISAVYDKHEDPNVVYDQMLSAYQKAVPPNQWQAYLHDASTPEGRQQFEKFYRDYLRNAALLSKNGAPPNRVEAHRREHANESVYRSADRGY